MLRKPFISEMLCIPLALALLGCGGGGGGAAPSADQKPVIATFTASPGNILVGGSTTLAWAVSGGSSLSITPGVGAITLASDSHAAAHLRRGFTDVAPLLRTLGFAEIHLPWDREHPVPLSDYL